MTETITAASYRTQSKKKSKFKNIRTEIDGHSFPSKKEANRYLQLREMERQGLISHLELQPSFKLYTGTTPVLIKSSRYPNGRHATYRADFAYFCHTRQKRLVEDVKGVRTKEFILKKALVEAHYRAVEIIEL